MNKEIKIELPSSPANFLAVCAKGRGLSEGSLLIPIHRIQHLYTKIQKPDGTGEKYFNYARGIDGEDWQIGTSGYKLPQDAEEALLALC